MSKNSRACALAVPGGRARRTRTAEDGIVAKKKISRNVEKFSRMRTGGAGGTCAQDPDRGRWKSCEKKKFHEMSKNSRACALAVPGGRARRTRTAEDGIVAKKKISRNVEKFSRMRTGGAGGTCAQDPDRGRWKSCEKKKFHEMSKNTRACALAVPGVRARRARTAEDGKVAKKKKFHEMSKNSRACALAVPGGRARRTRTAEDGIVAKKKISRNVEKFSRMRTGGAGGTCAQDPDRGRWKSCEKKKFHEMSKNSRACALAVPGGRARRTRTAEDGIVAKKKISRNVEKSSRMRTGGAGCTCAQDPDRGRWNSCEKKKFHEMSKNTRACALAVPGVRARRARTAEDGKVAKKKISRNVEKYSRMRTGGAGGTCPQGPDRGRWKSCEKKKISRNVEKYSRMRTGGAGGTCAQGTDRGRWKSCEKKKKIRKVEKNSRMRLNGTCRKVDKLSTAKLKIVK